VERVHRTAYPTRKKAKEDIARYIDTAAVVRCDHGVFSA
jgi:hypothetical protein